MTKVTAMDMLEKGKTMKWPPTEEESQAAGFVPQEVQKVPVTDRTKRIKARFLAQKCKLDPEFAILYTKEWKAQEGQPLYIRRALAYKYALEHVTPVINPDELIVMQKTRYMRGACAYLPYAQQFYKDFITRKDEDDKQLYDVGKGGGKAQIESEEWKRLGLFNIRTEDVEPLAEACDYWKGKCIEDVAQDFMKANFDEYQDLLNAWKVNLYPPSVVSIMEGRWIPAYDMIVERGLEDIIHECEQHIAETLPTGKEAAEKIMFWRACIITCGAVINWAANYAAKAEEMAAKEADPQRKQELLGFASMLRWVPARPARNFREALQSAWIGHIGTWMDTSVVGLSPGRWGQLLFPYYKKDLESGALTREDALELMENLRIKMSSEEYITPNSWAAMASSNQFQHLVVGGVDPKTGLCSDNELEEIILEAGMTMKTTMPTLGIMVSPRTSKSLLMKAAECTKAGAGYPAWFNYETMVQHVLSNHVEEGITLEDARNLGMAGCVEIGMQGMAHGICHPAFYNEPKTMEIAMNNGVDPRTGLKVIDGLKEIKTFEDLVDNFTKVRSKFMKVYMRYWLYVVAVRRQINPLMFSSVLMHDCVKKGKPQDDNGCRYNKSVTLLNSGLVNVANSLAALKKNVFEEHNFTLEEVMDALVNNFGFEKGDVAGNFSMLNQKKISHKYDKIHKTLLEAPKFGNDDDYVDEIFVKLWHQYNEICNSETTYLGYPWIGAGLSISAHGPFGRATGALPDGRLAGVTLTDGILSATPGTDVNGPIALIRSGVKLDPTKMRSVQLNMKIHPNAIRGVEGSRNFVDFIKTYFDQGGYHIQFNIVDSGMLLDAQQHPENYRDLIVRVAGFSAYWVELGKPIQDELIARTEYESTI
jgi:formate C-acetyltransferase/4-hydroxyphenylacetate decarboxylase large subunit